MIITSETILTCHAIAGREGIGQTYVGNITLEQFCKHFDVADVNNDEEDKLQRDPTKARAKGVSDYLTKRDDTVFPEVICITTKLIATPLEGVKSLNGVSLPVTLTLEDGSENMLVDGQGRRLGVEDALTIAKHLGKHTIDIKFVKAPSDTLIESKTFIRQIFADLHRKIQKPNSSINLFFDASEVSAVFAVKAYEHLVTQGMPINELVSLDGNTKRIWTLAQFSNFLSAFTGMSSKEMNTVMAEQAHSELYLNLLTSIMSVILATPIFKQVGTPEEIKHAKKNHLLCCAIGMESMGHLGKLVMDNAISQQLPVDWTTISKLNHVNFEKANKEWVGVVVDKHGKMLKGSAAKMAALIASQLHIPLNGHLIGLMAA
jgi:DNA sulfur modification protein DndB